MRDRREGRPTANRAALNSATDGDENTLTSLTPENAIRVTGVVQVDLSTNLDKDGWRESHRDRWDLWPALEYAPYGATVRVHVGSRRTVTPEALTRLREHAHRLHYEVTGDPRAVQVWVDALRSGRIGPWESM